MFKKKEPAQEKPQEKVEKKLAKNPPAAIEEKNKAWRVAHGIQEA